MRYYIKDEVSSAIKRKGTYVYIAGIAILCLLANLAMIAFRTIYGMNDGSYAYNLILFAEWVFVIPYYSTILIADIIFGKEYPNPHIKTKATIGLNRIGLYIGKFLSELIVAAIFMFAAIVLFLGITMLMASDGTIGWWTISDFIQKVLIAVPLWVAGVSIANCCLFFFYKKINAIIAYFAIVLLIPRLIMLLASEHIHIGFFIWIKKYLLITPRFGELQYFYTLNLPLIVGLGIVYTVLFCVIGIVAFKKREFR